MASWVFFSIPQLVENYRSQSAEGLSLAFLLVGFVGDVANLVGAAWAGLVPTVVALGLYFCVADAVLITQCLYYKYTNLRKENTGKVSSSSTPDLEDDAQRPLLERSDAEISDSTQPPSTAHRRRNSTFKDGSLPVLADVQSASSWTWNVASLLGVCIVGTVGWVVAWKAHMWTPTPANDNGDGGGPVGAIVLGYVSAVFYLGARIPQIVKNYKKKSCDGLSLLFFMLSLLGNATYGAGILFHSVSAQYIILNLPWLIGSLGTMGEDILIFIQFHIYAAAPGANVIE